MDSAQKINLRAVGLLSTLYTLANLAILISKSGYWDDYFFVIFLRQHDLTALWTHLVQYRSYALYDMFAFVLSLGGDPVFILKAACFIVWLVSAILLYIILRKIARLPDWSSFFISACFALFPAFPFKGEIGYVVYSGCITLFFAGILAYFKALTARNLTRYAYFSLSAVLLFFSFWNQALLVFYGGFLALQLFVLTRDGQLKSPWLKAMLPWAKRNVLFIALPLIYWLFHLSLGKPFGVAQGYTHFLIFNWRYLPTLLTESWFFVVYGFFWPFVASVSILERRIFAVLFLCFLAAVFLGLWWMRLKPKDTGAIDATPRALALWGAFMFFLGSFPYLAVGLYPTIYGFGFYQRYAILLSLGASLLILAAVKAVVNDRWHARVLAVLLALFMTYGVFNYFMLDMDWYRQRAIVTDLKQTDNTKILNASALVFHDEYREMEYMGRTVKTIDYILYLHEAFPNDFKTALAAEVGDVNPGETTDEAIARRFQSFAAYGAVPTPPDFDPTRDVQDVTVVTEADYELMTVANWLALKRAEIFDTKQGFQNALRTILKIKVVPYVPAEIAS